MIVAQIHQPGHFISRKLKASYGDPALGNRVFEQCQGFVSAAKDSLAGGNIGQRRRGNAASGEHNSNRFVGSVEKSSTLAVPVQPRQ